MITYELAKKLKEAGFPQTNIVVITSKDTINLNIGDTFTMDETFCSVPLLSELIEACDKDCKDFALFSSGNWICGDYMHYEGDWIVRAEGDTPEEAVSSLWLKLQLNLK